MSILLRETFLPFSSLYCEVFWNSKKWEDLCSLYCARSKGRRNLGERLESAGIWVKQRKLLYYRFAVLTLLFTLTYVERDLVVVLRSLSINNVDSYENVTEKVALLQTSMCSSHFIQINQILTIFFWSWIPKDCVKVQEKKKKVLSCVHVLHKMWNKEFLCGSGAMTAKK